MLEVRLLGNDAAWQQWCINTFSLYDCQQWWVEGKWILQLLFLWWCERMNQRIVRRRAEHEARLEAARRRARAERRHAKKRRARR